MQIVDSGVISPSYLDFTIPSEFARKNLYWVSQYGHYYCTSDYYIKRESIDSFLFIYISDGSLTIETKGNKITAGKNQLILLDCHFPHSYYCSNTVDFLWFHFSGNSSFAYCEYLYDMNKGILFEGDHIPTLKAYFESVLSCASSTLVNEHRISMLISRILSGLAAPESQRPVIHDSLLPAVSYISDNYSEDIPLEYLADLCGLSVSHFIRTFSKYIGFTPHEYLLSFRIRQAKLFLCSTSESIDEISIRCGFNSASHFARAFRHQEGITPTQFRNNEAISL